MADAKALFKRHYQDFVQNTTRSTQEASIYAACIIAEAISNEMAEELELKYVEPKPNGK